MADVVTSLADVPKNEGSRVLWTPVLHQLRVRDQTSERKEYIIEQHRPNIHLKHGFLPLRLRLMLHQLIWRKVSQIRDNQPVNEAEGHRGRELFEGVAHLLAHHSRILQGVLHLSFNWLDYHVNWHRRYQKYRHYEDDSNNDDFLYE